jgi:hypothetical protein
MCKICYDWISLKFMAESWLQELHIKENQQEID